MVECRKHFAVFFSLRKETLLFSWDEVKDSEKYEILLSDENFIGSLSFITDILTQLNILNKKLQQKDQNTVCANYLDILKLFAGS